MKTKLQTPSHYLIFLLEEVSCKHLLHGDIDQGMATRRVK